MWHSFGGVNSIASELDIGTFRDASPLTRAHEAPPFSTHINQLLEDLLGYLASVRRFKQDESGCDEDIAVERVFGAMLRPFAIDLDKWERAGLAHFHGV